MKQFVPPTVIDTREKTDVERLLQWAIGKQMADVIIEAAERPVSEEYRSSSAWKWVERVASLGTKVDGGGGWEGVAGLQIHPDAEIVYRTAREVLDGPSLIFVRDCARKGIRPDWNPFYIVTYEPAELVEKRGTMKARVRKMPNGAEFCPVAARDRARELVQYRELYLWWHQSVRKIESALLADDRLTRWRLVLWREPARPWADYSRS